MGLSYTCMLVKAGLAHAEAHIADAMKKFGYLPAAEGEATVNVYRRPDSPWFTVRSDVLQGLTDAAKLAKLLAKRFQGFALAMEAVDSDFLLLSLANPATNKSAKACIGVPYDGKKPKADANAWQTAADPGADLKTLFADTSLDAEAGLQLLARALGFSEADVIKPEFEETEPILTLRFESVEKEPVFVQEGLPVLHVAASPYGPLKMNEAMNVTFSNRNAASKGLDVIVYDPLRKTMR